MSEVKIVLRRSPVDGESGVWIDGIKVPGVKEVTVFGNAGEVPQVVLVLIPKVITMDLDKPDIDVVDKNEKN